MCVKYCCWFLSSFKSDSFQFWGFVIRMTEGKRPWLCQWIQDEAPIFILVLWHWSTPLCFLGPWGSEPEVALSLGSRLWLPAPTARASWEKCFTVVACPHLLSLKTGIAPWSLTLSLQVMRGSRSPCVRKGAQTGLPKRGSRELPFPE